MGGRASGELSWRPRHDCLRCRRAVYRLLCLLRDRPCARPDDQAAWERDRRVDPTQRLRPATDLSIGFELLGDAGTWRSPAPLAGIALFGPNLHGLRDAHLLRVAIPWPLP